MSTVSFEFGSDDSDSAPPVPPTTEELEQARLNFAVQLNTDAENVAIESVTNEVALSLSVADTATVALSDLNDMAATDRSVEQVSLSIQTATNIYVEPGEPEYEIRREELMQEAREELCDTLVEQGLCACGREASNGCPEGTVRVGAGTATDPSPGENSIAFDFALDVSEYTGDEALGPGTFAASNGRLQNRRLNLKDIVWRLEMPQTVEAWIEAIGFDLRELDSCPDIDVPCQDVKRSNRRRRSLLQAGAVIYLLENSTHPDIDVCLVTVSDLGERCRGRANPGGLDVSDKIEVFRDSVLQSDWNVWFRCKPGKASRSQWTLLRLSRQRQYLALLLSKTH